MNRVLLVCVLCLALAVSACSAPSQDNSVQGQLKGNQGLILVLENANQLDNLYLPYNGNMTPGASQAVVNGNPAVASGSASGLVQVGELNVLLHNVGQSATAGGLFVSGYDPNLINVTARANEVPINTGVSDTQCSHNIVVNGDQYEVQVFCDQNGGVSYGAATGSQGTQATIGGLNLDQYADAIASAVSQQNVDWFTKSGFFGSNGRVDCSSVNGQKGCRIIFGNPSADPNRALRGFLLLNLFYTDIANCKDNCRPFPPNFPTGQVMLGVSDQSPQGDALYYDYDIAVDRAKWPSQLNDLPQTFQISACYYYTTTLTPTVCVDPDPANNKGDPCTTAPLTFKQTQGSPVQVTSITQNPVPGGTMFSIAIKHVGNGQLLEPGPIAQCGPYYPGQIDQRRDDVVYLLSAQMAGDLQHLQCSPTNDAGQPFIRLQNGVGTINCFYNVAPVNAGHQAYQTALTLEFGYLYRNAITQQVVIHRV